MCNTVDATLYTNYYNKSIAWQTLKVSNDIHSTTYNASLPCCLVTKQENDLRENYMYHLYIKIT